MKKSRSSFKALLAAAALAAGWPGAAVAACPTSITTCGCTISSAGLYSVAGPLTGSPGSDCIQIKTASAVLNLQGNNITGSGGIGIHVLRGASSLMLEGQGASISGFTVGIQVEGSKVVGERFDLSNNLQAGLTMLKVKQVLFADVTANHNGGYGVLMSGGGTNEVSSLTANLNGGSGVLVQGSSTNLIDKFTANDNAVDGVYIACIPNKRSKTGCRGVSSGNLVYDGVATGNSQYGIEIGNRNSKGNFVGDNNAQNNSGGFDLVDDTAGCGGLLGNNWFTNLGQGNQGVTVSCVH